MSTVTGRLTECDDGNLVSGDGCSADCQLENTVRELEPNDSQATASVLPAGAIGRGGLKGPPGLEVDVWSFSALAGQTYVIETAAEWTGTCGGAIDTSLRLMDGTGALLGENDDIDSANNCSRITWTAPTSGTYYVEMRSFATQPNLDGYTHATSELGRSYFLFVRQP